MTRLIGLIVRFIVSALVLMVVSWLLPGISVNGFVGALIAAIVIALIGYVAENCWEKYLLRPGVVGFICAAAVIYLSQFIIPDYLSVSLLGSLLAALVIGLWMPLYQRH